jgi:hypothetical protein
LAPRHNCVFLSLDTLELHGRGPDSPCVVRRISASRRERILGRGLPVSSGFAAFSGETSTRKPREGRMVSRKTRLARDVY